MTEDALCSVCQLHAEAVFRVEGMDCNEEVVILERRLKPLAGFETLSADVMGQRLYVKYDAAVLSTSAMVDAVGQAGMRMWLEHEEPVTHGAGETRRWRLVVACGLVIAAGVACRAAGFQTPAIALFVIGTVLGSVFPAQRALVALRSRSLDINALMMIAVSGALVLGEWLEAASVVFLFAVAQWLEVRTLERARQAIRALIDLTPREASRLTAQGEERVSVDQIAVGDEIVVRPGDKVPLDGTVIEGRSDVNEAPLTGESLPVEKTAGDEVYAGTINGRGALDVRVTRLSRDARLTRIIHLVETAQASRAPVQSFVDRFARRYTPAVIGLAATIALVPIVAGGGEPSVWLYRSLVLLVIACPCALVISTPVSIVSALSAAARNGVLVKGGAYLERLAGVRVVAFDKTGTLTEGALEVTEVVATRPTRSVRDLIRAAAAAEARSAHPVARAIARHAQVLGVEVPPAQGFMSMPGMGVEAEVDGRRVLVGDARLLRERGVRFVLPEADLAAERTSGRSVVYVAVANDLWGTIALADRLRGTARDAVALLRDLGIRHVAMLTGDHQETAKRIASQVGVDECCAALTPEQKHEQVRELRAAHGPVLMVGDGVNDAPALAAADVGAAMGAAGSDAALETADLALMSDELLKLPYALRLARATLRNIKTNVTISLTLKAVFLVMAVTGSATLWMAVLADTGASVIVVGNALRLLRTR